jgi:hypothetical protein
MKERYDDGKLYSDDNRFFGPVAIRNYKEVLKSHNYSRYEKRFRALANRRKLSPDQRPKLNQEQFSVLMKQLSDAILAHGEQYLLEDEKNVKAARKLLIYDKFSEDETCV